MKKCMFLLYFTSVFVTINAQSGKRISFTDAWTFVKNGVEYITDSCDVYALEEPLASDVCVKSLLNSVQSPNSESWFFFIDMFPTANWGHDCIFVFVDCRTGKITTNKNTLPPLHLKNMLLLQKWDRNSSQPQRKLPTMKKNSIGTCLTPVLPRRDYAVIISGGGSPDFNYERYWNDCSAIYKTLRNVYNYPKNHIYVIMSDGGNSGLDRCLIDHTYDSSPLDLDDDGIDEYIYSAKKTNISIVFDLLAETLTEDDNLFIFTTDHGELTSSGNSRLVLWDGDYITDTEFASEVNKVHANHISVCMEQCYSGTFINKLQGNNRVIATACRGDEFSHATTNLLYDEFAYHWIASVTGNTPDGTVINADTDGNGDVSMSEAFTYAMLHDIQAEHPQYASTPLSLGDSLTLYNKDMYISGPSFVCDTSYYYICHLPQNASVLWSTTPATSIPRPVLVPDYPETNECIIRNPTKYPYQLKLNATIFVNGNVVKTLSKDIISEQNITTFKGYYSQDQCIFHGANHPAISEIMITHNPSTPHFVHQGCSVHLRSSWFRNKNVYYVGVTPDSWYYDGDQTVVFSLPYMSGGMPFRVQAYGEGSCGLVDILFFSVGGNGNVSNSSLNVGINGSDVTFSVSTIHSENQEISYSVSGQDSDQWSIEIYSTSDGSKVAEEKLTEDGTFSVSKSKFKSGFYIVSAHNGKTTLSEKFYIE